jgi:hypothetical protein
MGRGDRRQAVGGALLLEDTNAIVVNEAQFFFLKVASSDKE